MGFIFLIIKKILQKFSDLLYSSLPDNVKPPRGLLNKLKKPFPSFADNTKKEESGSFIERIKKKALKIIKDTFAKTLRAFGNILAASWDILLIVLMFFIVCMMLVAMMGAFGAFQGRIVVDMDEFQEQNQDEQIYMDAQNTNEMRKAYYQLVSETSYYQMFNLEDMNPETINPFLRVMQGITNNILPDSFSTLSDEDLHAINKGLMDSQAFFGQNNLLGVLGFDQRYIYSDANKNALKYLKSAKVIGVEKSSGLNPRIKEVNDYFRDYYNREETFMLSETLLSEMNRMLFGEFKNAESIVYPEAFVKPVPFVHDYYRIQTDSDSNAFGKPYVYVTQRIGKDEIENATSPYFGKDWLEGIIYTKPSKLVFDYAITSKNIYNWSDNDNDAAKRISWGNTSKYATYEEIIDYGDGTEETTEKTMKLYWLVKDSNDNSNYKINKTTYGYGEVNGMNPYNEHMTAGINEETYKYYFDGPYTRLIKVGDTVTVDPSSKIAENSVIYLDENGNHVDSSNGVKIRHDLNMYPTRHLQLAPMYDDEGNMSLNSRVLFNKTYVQKKSIKESYRHFPEYYSQFAEFVETDLNRLPPAAGLTTFAPDESELLGGKASKCTGSMYKEDLKKPFQKRQCSILRRYTGVNGLAWVKGKFAEVGTAVSNAVTGQDHEAELGVSSQAMFYILMAYEDYLIETGEYGVVWDYKYYTASEFDLTLAKAQYMDIYGWKEVFFDSWNDKGVYKDTLDTIKALDNAKTIQTQYVPTAIISGEVAATRDGNVNINNIGYGWRVKEGANLDNPGEQILERVAGEASLEYPVYSTGKMKDIINKYLYGTIIYGPSDFRFEWDGDDIKDKGEADINAYYADLEADAGAEVADEFQTEYNERDYRNKDYAWNPDADVYRPSVRGESILNNLTSSIQKKSGDGKVTYMSNPNDNLPLEVKSVRDYGLGSVLSYLEGLRVVYQSGVFMDEAYSKNGIKKVFDELGLTGFSQYQEGYYPKALLDVYPQILTAMRTTPMTIEELSAFAQNVLSLQYAATDEEYELTNSQKELMEAISNRNANGVQVTGLDTGKQGFIIEDNGNVIGTNICRNCEADDECGAITDEAERSRCINTCRLEGGYYNSNLYDCKGRCETKNEQEKQRKNLDSLTGEEKTKEENELSASLSTCNAKCETDWPNRSTTCTNVDTSAVGSIYAYAPYITPSYLDSIGEKLFGWLGYDTLNEVQFLDPLQYYVEWFDYFANRDNFLDKTLSFITGENLVSQLDSSASKTLRAVQGDKTKGFEGVTSPSYFGSAGKKIRNAYKDEFYDKYTMNIQPFKLISESETYRVYMIEEAVTFLGTFTYTYKDDIINLGTGGGNKQITSMAYADRYYYMSNYIFSIPYIVFEAETFGGGTITAIDTKPRCPNDAWKKARDKYANSKWYNPFTWFSSNKEILDADVGCSYTSQEFEECETEIVNGKEVETCTSYTEWTLHYEYVASVGRPAEKGRDAKDSFRIDTLDEVDEILEASGDSTLKDRVMIQMKVFNSLKDWSWTWGTSNKTDFKENLIHDYDIEYQAGTTYLGDEKNHYIDLSVVNKNIVGRKGYRVKSEFAGMIDDKNLPDDLNMDIDYDAGLNAPKTLKESDLGTILTTAKKIDTSQYIREQQISVGGEMVGIDVGIKLTDDSKNIGVGLMVANREDYGYPIPLFRHFSGSLREILPRERGSYFNGETLESWQTRLVITEDSSNGKIKHVDDEKYTLQNYLYAYITNFETYVPYDVKSDYDLMSRGREAYHSTNASMVSTTAATSPYAGEIFTLTDNEAWKETVDKFSASDGKVTQSSIAQIISGLIEVELDRAPVRAIKLLNSRITDKNLQIKLTADNQTVIRDAISKSATDSGATTDTRMVKLILENGTMKEFSLPFFGAGGIFYDYDLLGDGEISSNDFAPGQRCGEGQAYLECFKEVKLEITADEDDRLIRQKSIEFVSSRFGRLLRKYGETSKAIMAYFYGEQFTETLVVKAEALGKGSNWANKDDNELISEVLKELVNNSAAPIDSSKIDMSMYTSSVIAKTLSYVQDATSKTTLTAVAVVPANATGVDIGSKAEIGQQIYDKWASYINLYAPQYGVDKAVLAAMLSQESTGNSYSGICQGDGMADASMLATRRCSKLNINLYNGGGGVGQIHHFCDGGGQLPSRPSGTCTRTITSTVVPDKTLVVRQALPSRFLQSTADLAAFEAMDDRYGNIPLAFEWSVIYISNSLKAYDGDVYKTLVAYNAGAGTVDTFVKQCGESGWYNCYANSASYGQKHNYVKAVMRYYNENLSTNELKFSGTTSSLSSVLSSNFGLKTAEIHYNRDLFSYQNSGVELFKPSLSKSRNDVKMLLMNNYNFGKQTYETHANKYDLMSLFTQRKAYDTSGADGAGQSWIGFNSQILSLGKKTTSVVPSDYKFAHISPLIPMNSPTGKPIETERITSQFGMRDLGGMEMHHGIDFGIPTGTPIYSVAPGRVVASSFDASSYGYYIKVEHILPENTIITNVDQKQYQVVKLFTLYAHHSSNKVSVGDIISEDCSNVSGGGRCIDIDDPIALAGSTGRSTGPHLHFEINVALKDLITGQELPQTRPNREVDPLYWLTTKWGSNSSMGGNAMTQEEIENLMSNIKRQYPNLSATRENVVRNALSLVGRVPYFWGGGHGKVSDGFNPDWGTVYKKVTAAGSKTTGKTILDGLDCSGFARWAIYNGTGEDLMNGTARHQRTLGSAIAKNQLQPGDFGNYADDSHVGIFLYMNEKGEPVFVHENATKQNVSIGTARFAYFYVPKGY